MATFLQCNLAVIWTEGTGDIVLNSGQGENALLLSYEVPNHMNSFSVNLGKKTLPKKLGIIENSKETLLRILSPKSKRTLKK